MAVETPPYTLGDYFDVVRRRWRYVAVVLPTALLLSVYLAFVLPPMYLSSGTILLEQATVPDDLVRTTVTTYANQQIELVHRRVMTVDNLASLVGESDPYPNERVISDRAKARLILENTSLEKVDPLTLEPLLESPAFSVHYYNPDPEIAVEIANKLVGLFLSYNRVTRTERASRTYRFLGAQSDAVEQRLELIEKRLADFKVEYGDAIPEAQAHNLSALDRAERDVDALQRQILDAEERIKMFDFQLTQISPNLFEDGGGWQAELAQLKSDLAAALQRYTEEHPDVRRLRRAIEALSERINATEQYQPTVAPDNPDYLRVASQQETVERELDVLHLRVDRGRAQILTYSRRIAIAPDVEREYRQLIREHDIEQSQYRDIQNKLSQAALAQTLETEDQGERFSLIRTPRRPSTPDSPNRVGIILLGFVLGAALSAGLVAVKESVDPSIRSARDLAEITDIKPIGAIPMMLSRTDRQKRRFAVSAAVFVFLVAVTVVGSTVAKAHSDNSMNAIYAEQ